MFRPLQELKQEYNFRRKQQKKKVLPLQIEQNKRYCQICNTLFYQYPSVKQKFCSQKCNGLHHSKIGKYNNETKTIECTRCSKVFEASMYRYRTNTKNGHRNYCSFACSQKKKGDYIFYKHSYLCLKCSKWIKKENAIVKRKGIDKGFYNKEYTLKQDHYYCPKCNEELRTDRRYKKIKERKYID